MTKYISISPASPEREPQNPLVRSSQLDELRAEIIYGLIVSITSGIKARPRLQATTSSKIKRALRMLMESIR